MQVYLEGWIITDILSSQDENWGDAGKKLLRVFFFFFAWQTEENSRKKLERLLGNPGFLPPKLVSLAKTNSET